MSIGQLVCLVRGHRLRTEVDYGYGVLQVSCRRCQQLFGLHQGLQIVLPWDSELEALGRMMLTPKGDWDLLAERMREVHIAR